MSDRPDPDLALAALAAGMRESEARTLAGKPRLPKDERYTAARKAGSLARRAPHLVTQPEPLAPERYHEYSELVLGGELPSSAARKMGVDPLSVYLARVTDEDFAKLEAAAEAMASEDVEAALKEAALAGDTRSMIYYLENRNPGRWRPSAGQGSATVNVNVGVEPADARMRLDEIRRELSIDIGDGHGSTEARKPAG